MFSKWRALISPLFAFWILFGHHGADAAVVSSPTFADLSAAIAASTNVQLKFNGSLQFPAPITITNRVVVDATGYSVAFDGGGANQLFCVTSGGDLTLTSITLRNGYSPNRDVGSSGYGGAIVITNGALTLNNCSVSNNRAAGLQGAISIKLITAYVYDIKQTNSGGGEGGAIYATNSKLTFNACVFENNHVEGAEGLFESLGFSLGGVATSGGRAYGACVAANNSALEVKDCIFRSNSSVSGRGYYFVGSYPHEVWAGSGGGAIDAEMSNVAIRGSAFFQNASGHGRGGALLVTKCNFTIEDSSISSNSVEGDGGAFGLGGTGVVARCIFSGNSAIATEFGSTASGGAIYNSADLQLLSCSFMTNRIVGAPAYVSSTPGISYQPLPARGGAACSTFLLNATNCIFYGNSARTGDGSPSGLSPAAAGAAVAIVYAFSLSPVPTSSLTHCSFASNIIEVAAYPDQTNAPNGTAVWVDGRCSLELRASVLARSDSNPLVFGTNITDVGFNISADGTPPFTEISSVNNTDPRLSFVSSSTYAILQPQPGSPAIDHVSQRLTAFDIRGIVRPQTGCDAGAVEMTGSVPVSINPNTGVMILSTSTYTDTLKIFGSADFKTWTFLGEINSSNRSFSLPGNSEKQFLRFQTSP